MRDEIRVDGVHALVGDRLQDAGHGRGSDRSALAGGDLAGVGQRDRVEGARRQLAGEDREPPAELDVGRSFGWVSGDTDGALTAYGGVTPPSAIRTCSAISRPTRSCASAVEAPRWGVSTRFGAPRSGLSAAIGSVE